MARTSSLTGQFGRFVRGDGWCFDVGMSQMANRWLVQGARERARGPRMAIGEQLTCLGNDNDTVVLIVTGAVEFVACPFDDRVHS